MKWKTLFGVAIPTLLLSIVAVAENQKPEGKMPETPLKAVVHINFDDAERQEHGLGNVENILKEVADAQIEVVCHGAGIGMLHQETTAHAKKVQTLMQQKVRFTACENTMQKKSITRSELLPGVETVASGAVEILRKQHKGYAYFRP